MTEELGRLNGSISAADTCPDFSSANIVLDNPYNCALQKNSVESHFVISKRTKGDNRTTAQLSVQQSARFAVLFFRLPITPKCEFI